MIDLSAYDAFLARIPGLPGCESPLDRAERLCRLLIATLEELRQDPATKPSTNHTFACTQDLVGACHSALVRMQEPRP